MKAHVEFLSGIVRVGPFTDAYGKDYDYSAAWASVDGKTAIIKGLVSPDKMLSRAHAAMALAEVQRRTGLKTDWERAIATPTGEIVMTKHVLPHVDTAKQDGVINLAAVKDAVGKAFENAENGHSKLISLDQADAGDGSGDTVYTARVHHN